MTGLAGEGDYTFEFRAFDGIDYSTVVSRTVKLNTQPPTVFVSSPSSFSSHDEGSVVFDGYAQDPYGVQMTAIVTSVWCTWTYLAQLPRLQAQSRQMKTGLGIGNGISALDLEN